MVKLGIVVLECAAYSQAGLRLQVERDCRPFYVSGFNAYDLPEIAMINTTRPWGKLVRRMTAPCVQCMDGYCNAAMQRITMRSATQYVLAMCLLCASSITGAMVSQYFINNVGLA